MLRRFCVVFVFGVAFAYIESAVVVYLREIFYTGGFDFPLELSVSNLWGRILFIEIGRETATLVLILTSCSLFGRNLRQRFAYFLTIFAVWDIFYYVWLKVLLDWPASIMDWDILFLIPLVWASPVLAPVLASVTLLIFSLVILYRDCRALPLKVTLLDWLGFIAAMIIIVISFCIAGLHTAQPNYQSHFSWGLFLSGELLAIGLFLHCLIKSRQQNSS